MDTQLSGNTSRRTRQAQQEGGQNPVGGRPLALVEQGMGEVVEGPLAAVAPVALAAGAVVVLAPWINVVALTAGALQGAIFPSQRMDVDVTLFSVAELVQMGEHRHG